MSSFSSPVDILPVTKALSSTVNNLDAAVAAAFALLPTETNLTRGTVNFAVDTGVVNAYVVALPHVPSGYVDGLMVRFRALNTNTAEATINVNSLGVKSIKDCLGGSVAAGDIRIGVPLEVFYSVVTGFFHTSAPTAGQLAAQVSLAAAQVSLAAAQATTAAVQAGTATTQAVNASTSAAQAAASAASLFGTSTTSRLIATTSMTFTTQPGKSFTAGARITATSAANLANWMFGQVISYTGTVLTVDVQVTNGSGTFNDWNLSISGARGATGVGISQDSVGFHMTGGTSTSKTLIVDADLSASGLLAIAASGSSYASVLKFS